LVKINGNARREEIITKNALGSGAIRAIMAVLLNPMIDRKDSRKNAKPIAWRRHIT
jgi:hypothetical protein